MPNALKIENIHMSFPGNCVLKGASMALREGSISGLIGPSGSGKSVLLKIAGGVMRPDRGTVAKELHRKKYDNPAQEISLMFQEGALFDSISVFDNVAFPLVQGRVPSVTLPYKKREEMREKVSAALSRVGLTNAAHKMPAQLSGGMRRRVSLARALVARPEILLLDDPTCGLDPVASSVIMNLIVEMHKDYRPTVLIVSHDLRRLFPIVDTIFALFGGKICFGGTLEDLKVSDHSLLRTFAACRYDLAA